MNESITHIYTHFFHSWMNQSLWINRVNKIFNDSLIKSLDSFLDETVFLSELDEWMIQWPTHMYSHLHHSWINQCLWMNWINEWFNDSLIYTVTCSIPYLITVFLIDALNDWFNRSLINMVTCFNHQWISV